jgi:hypothetical protein
MIKAGHVTALAYGAHHGILGVKRLFQEFHLHKKSTVLAKVSSDEYIIIKKDQ